MKKMSNDSERSPQNNNNSKPLTLSNLEQPVVQPK